MWNPDITPAEISRLLVANPKASFRRWDNCNRFRITIHYFIVAQHPLMTWGISCLSDDV